ncbi:MAG: hypothetical protein HYV63_26895 [Candidatus Schekmanbacteria bacterium]|nr:hypothetical protein [Candidatus Schekmanbacteria bacterium]
MSRGALRVAQMVVIAAAAAVLASGCAGTRGSPVAAASAEQRFAALRANYLHGSYEDVVAAAETLEADRQTPPELVSRAILLRARAELALGRPAAARESAARLLARFPASPLVPEAEAIASSPDGLRATSWLTRPDATPPASGTGGREGPRPTPFTPAGRPSPVPAPGSSSAVGDSVASVAPGRGFGSPDTPPRLRGVQVLRFGTRNRHELGELMSRWARAGIDTIIVRVFQNSGDRPLLSGPPPPRAPALGVYFRSETAPTVDDVLGEILPMAATRGLAVYAWMTTRYLDWLTVRRPELRERVYDPDTGSLGQAPGACIFEPAVRAHLVALYRELAAYPIQGILLQDDLVLRQREGLAPAALGAFSDAVGHPVTPGSLFGAFQGLGGDRHHLAKEGPSYAAWIDFKVRSLLDLASLLMRQARAVRPELRFISNLYYETLSAPANGRQWVAQDALAAKARAFDYLAFMTYHRQIADELGLGEAATLSMLTRMAAQAQAAIGDPNRVVLKLQTSDWRDHASVPVAELRRVMAALGSAGTTSLIYVPHEPDAPIEAIGSLFAGR